LETNTEPLSPELEYIWQMGIAHEEQHQELLVQDIKQVLWWNIEHPGYGPAAHKWAESDPQPVAVPLQFLPYPTDGWLGAEQTPKGDFVFERSRLLCEIGARSAFYFDNEAPAHEVYLPNYSLANRPVTCGEYREFIEAGGYREPRYWLSDGWKHVQEHQWQAPLYWELHDSEWWLYTLAGMRPLNPHEPVCHVSYYEAEAYATFRQARLPTEYEWENAARLLTGNNHLEDGWLHPRVALPGEGLLQLASDVWEWTSSPYVPYPGYRAPRTGLGEYNGKFMANQQVLRGGSFATPQRHLRRTYRNFYRPHDRWQPAGIRLAQ
jgi:ergothioneine biosynthesis protein EgtB